MIDIRLKNYFTIVRMYHTQPSSERPKMLAGYVKAASITNDDPFTRELLSKFVIKESNRYGNSKSKPPSVA